MLGRDDVISGGGTLLQFDNDVRVSVNKRQAMSNGNSKVVGFWSMMVVPFVDS